MLYLTSFWKTLHVHQVRELLTNYGKVSVLWWDYDAQMKSAEGKNAGKRHKIENQGDTKRYRHWFAGGGSGYSSQRH